MQAFGHALITLDVSITALPVGHTTDIFDPGIYLAHDIPWPFVIVMINGGGKTEIFNDAEKLSIRLKRTSCDELRLRKSPLIRRRAWRLTTRMEVARAAREVWM